MSYSAVVDIILHFHSFRNIDLFHQGLYNLRVCVYQDLSESRVEKSPPASSVSSKNLSPASQGSRNPNQGLPSECAAAVPFAILPAKLEKSDFSQPDPSSRISSGCKRINSNLKNSSSGLTTRRRSLSEHGSKKLLRKADEDYDLPPPQIHDENQTFTTRTFLIRFRDEETELNEMCQFRIELDLCRSNGLSAPFYMEVDLMYSERNVHSELRRTAYYAEQPSRSESETEYGASAEWRSDQTLSTANDDLFSSPVSDSRTRSTSTVRESESPPPRTFVSVSYQTYQLQNVASGIHEYIPVIFDEFHYSLLSMTVHSVLQDIRCRLRPNILPCAYQPRHCIRKPPATLTYPTGSSTDNVSVVGPFPSLPPDMAPRSFTEFLLYGHRALRNHQGSRVRVTSPMQQPQQHKGMKPSRSRQKSASEVLQPDTKQEKEKGSSTKLLSTVGIVEPGPAAVAPSLSVIPPSIVPSSSSATSCCPLQSPLIYRADILHAEYLRVLLESLLRLISVFRCFSYRGLASRQRTLLGSCLDVNPIQLPGGHLVVLPGMTLTTSSEQQHQPDQFSHILSNPGTSLPLSPSGDSVDSQSNQSNRSHSTITELPQLPFSGPIPKGSGSSYYANDDLMTVTFHLTPEVVEEEVQRLEEELEIAARLDGVLVPNRTTMKDAPRSIQAKIPQLSSRLSSHEPSAIAAIMTQDFQLIAAQIVELWQRFLVLLQNISAESETLLRCLYERRITDRWKESIFRETCTTSDIALPSEKAVWEMHQRVSDHLRKSGHFLSLEPLPITEMFFVPSPEMQPILFEQRYVTDKEFMGLPAVDIARQFNGIPTSVSRLCRSLVSTSRGNRGIHLFVLVHGFQGNSCDMRLLRNSISVLYPSAMVLCSSANEDDTEKCIEAMGLKLAYEVTRYVDDVCPNDTMSQISFICHSLGGVIARSALMSLKSLWPKLYTFLSLSSPHLGYMYNCNKLVDAGMWFLKKWKKSQSLLQLTLSDAKSVRESFLFNLALQSEPLGYFENVCLMSSYQDQYVPFESARMEISGRAESDARIGALYAEMARLATRFIDPKKLTRLDVNFKITEKTLDTLIGRSAHIMFLENQVVMRMLVHAYPHFFW